MEEELLKRNTDCVYFLASPFTCKKGAECEYRHSDMARLNPRDCWYWLSGSCLNPTCAFRHPPLEIHTESSSEAAASLMSQSSAPSTKTTVPCYFYYNGFCSKGDRCPFLHEADDASAWKPKTAHTFFETPVPVADTKTSGRTDIVSAPVKKHSAPPETAMISDNGLQVWEKQQVQQSAATNILDPNTSTKANTPDYEETAAVKTASSSQPAEDLSKSDSEPSLDSHQSSEDLIDGNIVRDEWWESSPGFDVLVDGKTEDMMAFEDDPEYLHALDGNDGDHHREHLFIQHGYADQIDYGEREFYRNGLYYPSDYLDDERRAEHGRYSPRHRQDRKVQRLMSRKRKFLSVEFPVGGRNNVDLRDYLRKRRMVDGYLETRALRHDDVARIRDERHTRRLQRHATNRLPRRIASKVERDGVGLSRRRTSAVDLDQRVRPRNSQRSGSRQSNGMRRRQFSSEGQQRRSFLRREKDVQVSTAFAGPKSLSEIKEEKKQGHSHKNGSVDFEGPKPLSEILKEKKKSAFSTDDYINSSS